MHLRRWPRRHPRQHPHSKQIRFLREATINAWEVPNCKSRTYAKSASQISILGVVRKVAGHDGVRRAARTVVAPFGVL